LMYIYAVIYVDQEENPGSLLDLQIHPIPPAVTFSEADSKARCHSSWSSFGTF